MAVSATNAAARHVRTVLTDIDSLGGTPTELVAVSNARTTSTHAFRSHDAGSRWEKLPFPAGVQPRSIRFDASAPGRLIANTSRGILYSVNNGISWGNSNLRSPAAGFDVERGFRALVYAVFPTGDPRIPHTAIFVSFDHGRTFSARPPLYGTQRILVDPTSSGALYAVDTFGSVSRSANAAQSFVVRSRLARSPVLAFTADGQGTLWAAIAAGALGRSVWTSRDRGTSWEVATEGIEAADVLALAESPQPGRWWAGLGSETGSIWSESHSGIWSQDDGTWSPHGLRTLSIGAVSPHPVLANEIVATSIGGGIARSIDGGATWTSSSALAGYFVSDVDRDPTEPRHLLAVGELGVVVSHDDGEQWSQLGVSAGGHLRFSHDGRAFYASLGGYADVLPDFPPMDRLRPTS